MIFFEQVEFKFYTRIRKMRMLIFYADSDWYTVISDLFILVVKVTYVVLKIVNLCLRLPAFPII